MSVLGPDKVPPEVVKELVACAPEFVIKVLNSLLVSQNFPACWKQQTWFCCGNMANQYTHQLLIDRLVYWIQQGGKLFEALICRRLQNEIHDRDFSEKQYGFRKERSTLHAVESILKVVKVGFEKYSLMVTMVLLTIQRQWWQQKTSPLLTYEKKASSQGLINGLRTIN